MDATYGQQYRNLYKNHWWWRARERYVLDIISGLGVPHGIDILDVGCGDGLFFEALSAVGTPFGIEPDEALLSDNPWRDHIYCFSFDESFELDRQFGLVLMLDVLEHLDDDVSALKKSVNLLKPNGKVLATVPALMSAWTAHDKVNQHRRRYKRSTFEAIFKSAGLKMTFCRYYFVWTYFPKVLLSLKERVFGESTSQAQTQIPRHGFNSFITSMSYFEHRLFHHLPIPFGTSLIAVGEKM
jgi:SAM-dependent methyltransferase